MDDRELRQQMVECGRLLWERRLIGANEGNLSARLANRNILMTPSGACKGQLSIDSLSVIDIDGNLVSGGAPSSETLLHLTCYRSRPECKAVVHAHPTTATGLSVAGKSIPPGLLPEADVLLGPVALVPFAKPGSPLLSKTLAKFLPEHKTFLLSHHGALALGASLADATARMETLERVAAIYCTALQLGRVTPLPEADQSWLRHYRHGHFEIGASEQDIE
jgi:L-fuculose-phosphate aldolase